MNSVLVADIRTSLPSFRSKLQRWPFLMASKPAFSTSERCRKTFGCLSSREMKAQSPSGPIYLTVPDGMAGFSSPLDRKGVVSGKRVSVRVDLGCRRILKKKKHSKPCVDDGKIDHSEF